MKVGRSIAVAVVAVVAVFRGMPQARVVGGTIVGVITTRETARTPLRITVDPDVCGSTLPDESVRVDGLGHVNGAVATVTGVKAPAPAEAILVNDTCRFLPRVSLLRPKGALRMSSRDRVMHTVHAAGPNDRALFNLSLPLPNVALSRPIDKPGVVTLSCSTHTWMRGYVVVTDELSAVSGDDGTFRLDGVPAGTQEVRLWHEALRATPIRATVKDGEITTVALTLVK